MLNRVGSWGEALLVLEGDPHVAKRHGVPAGELREEIYHDRRHRVNDIVKHVVTETQEGATFGTKLGRYMLRPWTGIPIFGFVIYAMYYLIGVLVAQDIVGFSLR